VALERWPVDGIPERPGAWLFTVARRRALNQLSRDARYRTKLVLLTQPLPQAPDDRIRLMFACCHPALPRAAQVALTLRAICGFTTAEIAHAFLASETAVAHDPCHPGKKFPPKWWRSKARYSEVERSAARR
jgi:predicted RNA polymerase sigma factor